MTLQRIARFLVAMSFLVVDVPAQNDAGADLATCAQAGFAPLKRLEGEWNVTGSIRLADGEWADVRGRARIAQDLDGCVLVESFRDDREGRSFSAIALFSFDAIDGRLQKTWIDSAHGFVMLFRGGLLGERMVFSASKEIAGVENHVVEQYAFDGDDVFVLERRRAAGDRTSWRATGRLVYERD